MNSLLSNFRGLFGFKPPTPAVLTLEEFQEQLAERRRQQSSAIRNAIAQACVETNATGQPVRPSFPLTPYIPPAGVCPKEIEYGLAMDKAWGNLAQDTSFSLNNLTSVTSTVLDGLGFPGFPYLTELTQITEYRDVSERTAAEMTRKWIELRSVSKKDKSELIKRLNKAMLRHQVRDKFRLAATFDGTMGRAQLFPNLGEDSGVELETPLMLNKYKIRKGSLRGFKLIEPITTYPAVYNSSNPLASDYYQPSAWFVYGQKIDASRLLTFESRPLPDLLKPVYNFSGISLSQLAQPYIDYWLGTRDSVGKLLKNFSITNLETDLDTLLGLSGKELLDRVKLFTRLRDSQGIFMTNKDHEALKQLNTPLSGLADLLAQAQEHIAAVAKTPLVILLGSTPKGLNPSAEGEIKIYYDYVNDQQEKLFRRNLEIVLQIIMLDELGYVDEDITFDFVSLFALTGKEQAMIRKSDGETDGLLIEKGVVTPEEVRAKLAEDPESGYNNLDVSKVPVPPAPFGGGGWGNKGSITAKEEKDDSNLNPNLPDAGSTADIALDIMDYAAHLAQDGGFRGNQHLGGFKDNDEPLSVAMRLSAAAMTASRKAKKLGTRTAHTQAHKAHSRALEAHTSALSPSDSPNCYVHEAYRDAHEAAAQVHKATSSELNS